MERLGVEEMSFDPKVECKDWPQAGGFDTAVGAARTCYAQNLIKPEDVKKKPELAEKIHDAVYEAGHHTTIQHPQYGFTIKGISRQCLWTFLHSHPFYNSEQQSQRYVEMKPENFVIPPIPESDEKEIFLDVVREQVKTYKEIIEDISPGIEEDYYRVYPKRRNDPEKWKNGIHKRALEVARYVLPVAMKANLYHTVSGVSLLRYHKMSRQYETPLEARILIGRMVEAAMDKDPQFFRRMEDPVPIEQTPEYAIMAEFYDGKRG